MPRKKVAPTEVCCPPSDDERRYEVEAVAKVDERGQMVLPKSIREKAGIKAGDKLAIVTLVRDGRVCCLHLFRAGDLVKGVTDVLEPRRG
ncbi:MAG: HgcAB-associated protein [Methanomassiliicoccales archaeon]|nr:HgcAB-associated protein [Methanomassiliicoccales archaeon]